MSILQTRFHVVFDGQRTTVSVDTILFELMALKLGVMPDDETAHSVVRQWLQDNLVSNMGDRSGRKSASQFARRYLIRAIADKRLTTKRTQWIVKKDK